MNHYQAACEMCSWFSITNDEDRAFRLAAAHRVEHDHTHNLRVEVLGL